MPTEMHRENPGSKPLQFLPDDYVSDFQPIKRHLAMSVCGIFHNFLQMPYALTQLAAVGLLQSLSPLYSIKQRIKSGCILDSLVTSAC